MKFSHFKKSVSYFAYMLRSKNASLFFLFAVLLFSSGAIFAQNTNPYSAIKYDSVVMYDYNSPFRPIIDEDGNLETTVSKFTKLNDKEIAELNRFLDEKSSFGNSAFACFDPHLGIVYYRNGKPEGHLSICMHCNRLKANPALPALAQDAIGMSKTLRKFLNNLLVANNFSHTIESGSKFDE